MITQSNYGGRQAVIADGQRDGSIANARYRNSDEIRVIDLGDGEQRDTETTRDQGTNRFELRDLECNPRLESGLHTARVEQHPKVIGGRTRDECLVDQFREVDTISRR